MILLAFCIDKCLNPSVQPLLPAIGKKGQIEFFSIGKGKLYIQINCIPLKNWPCVTSYLQLRNRLNAYIKTMNDLWPNLSRKISNGSFSFSTIDCTTKA